MTNTCSDCGKPCNMISVKAWPEPGLVTECCHAAIGEDYRGYEPPKPTRAQAIRDAKRRGDKWIIWSGQMIRLDEVRK